MADYTKITNEDLVGHKIEELADTPAITTAALKKRFDSLSVDVIIPKFNGLVDAVNAIDTTISDVTTKEYVDESVETCLSSAKTYADTQDSTTLASAKSYADTKDASTLATAKSYADSEDTTTLASAKSYADSKDTTTLDSAMAHADLVANNAYNSAKAYTDANAVKNVTVNALYDAGNKIATISVDGTETEVYAPSGGGGGGGGTSDYSELSNKPSINGTTLNGNKTASQLGFATVATSGSYNDLSNAPTLANVATTGLAEDITTDEGVSLQEALDGFISPDKIKNELDVTEEGYVLDARAGKALCDIDKSIMGGDAYNSTLQYNVGDCCLDENALWKCILPTLNIKPSDDDGTHWKKMSLAQVVSDFQVGVNTIYNAMVAKGVTPASKSPSDIVAKLNSNFVRTGSTTVSLVWNGSTKTPSPTNTPGLKAIVSKSTVNATLSIAANGAVSVASRSGSISLTMYQGTTATSPISLATGSGSATNIS